MTMLSNETVRKLHEIRLGVMAEAFSAQLADAQFQSVSFEDRFAKPIDRKSHPLLEFSKIVYGSCKVKEKTLQISS